MRSGVRLTCPNYLHSFSTALQNFKIPKKPRLQPVVVIPESSGVHSSRRSKIVQAKGFLETPQKHYNPEKVQSSKYLYERVKRPTLTYNNHLSKATGRPQDPSVASVKRLLTASETVQVEALNNHCGRSEESLLNALKGRKGRTRCPECRRRHARKDCPSLREKRASEIKVAILSRVKSTTEQARPRICRSNKKNQKADLYHQKPRLMRRYPHQQISGNKTSSPKEIFLSSSPTEKSERLRNSNNNCIEAKHCSYAVNNACSKEPNNVCHNNHELIKTFKPRIPVIISKQTSKHVKAAHVKCRKIITKTESNSWASSKILLGRRRLMVRSWSGKKSWLKEVMEQ